VIFLTNIVAAFWLFLIVFTLMFLFTSLYMGAKARGIERAMWAIVSQLRATRLDSHADVDPAATRMAREVAETGGKVAHSMFGR
jgi:hypothetical protein